MSDQYVYVNNCTTDHITTSAYAEICSSSTVSTSSVQFIYHNALVPDEIIKLAVGTAGNEVDMIVCATADPIQVQLYTEPGTRFSAQSIGSNVTSGYVILSLLP